MVDSVQVCGRLTLPLVIVCCRLYSCSLYSEETADFAVILKVPTLGWALISSCSIVETVNKVICVGGVK